MKIKDLITLLSKYDPEIDVVTANDGEDPQEEQLTEMFSIIYRSSGNYKGDYEIYRCIGTEEGINNSSNYKVLGKSSKVMQLYLALNNESINFENLGTFNDKVQVSQDSPHS